ncbi:MAG: CAP domain-containing protein [Demequinaceae bacterium]|nr:CAP domain-containing protein [Demequinaceae bacterium]
MTKKRQPDDVVEAQLLETRGIVPNDGNTHAGMNGEAGARQDLDRRRRRRFIWPFVLATVLAASTLTIAKAATLPPLVTNDALAGDRFPTDAAQAPIDAVVPTAGPVASAKPVPFGPQLEVVLPPPPPTAGGTKGSAADRRSAAAALTTAQYCDGKYGATSSASSLEGLLAAANAERAVFGLGALSWNGALATAAQDWSSAMAGASDPASPGTALSHGMLPSPGGQNVAAAWTTAPSMAQATAIAKAHSGWMASPGHCKNILRASFTSMGAGTAASADGKAWYTTVDFQ